MEDLFVSDGITLAPKRMFDGRYRLIRPLDNSKTTISIWLARDVNTVNVNASANEESSGRLVSLMICQPSAALDIEEEQRWQDEFDAAHECCHPNLLPPEEYAVLNDTYYLVFPYTERASLSQFIGKNMSETMTWKLILDMASGLNELHTHQPQVIHGDIKPSNVYLYDNNEFVLTHYGIHFETDTQRIEEHSGCLAYMAPERFLGASVSKPESDIWAFGAMLYEILKGVKPFGEEGGKNQRRETPMPPLPNQPTEIRDLIYACLQADPKKRPNAQHIIDIVSSKKIIAKSKKKNYHNRDKEKIGNKIQNKNSLTAIVAVSVVLLGVLVYLLIPRHREVVPESKGKAKQEVVEINYYEKAVNLLSDNSTAATGRKILDSLVSARDWRAKFLLSRLYFDTRGYDTILYDKDWEKMRVNCGISYDNERAHEYLFDAFELHENDYMILYQLGCDYMAGTARGCKRKLEYALWCFDHAESTLEKSSLNYGQHLDVLKRVRERIPADRSPIKPTR